MASVETQCLDIINKKLQPYRVRAISETLSDFVFPTKEEIRLEGALLKLESARLQLEAFLKLLGLEIPKQKIRTGLQYISCFEKMADASDNHVTWHQGIEWITDTKSSADMNILNAIKAAVAGKDLSTNVLYGLMTEYIRALEKAKNGLKPNETTLQVDRQRCLAVKSQSPLVLLQSFLTENQISRLKEAQENCIDFLDGLILHPTADEQIKRKSQAIKSKIIQFEKNNHFALQDTENYLTDLMLPLIFLGEKIKIYCKDKERMYNLIVQQIDSILKSLSTTSLPSQIQKSQMDVIPQTFLPLISESKATSGKVSDEKTNSVKSVEHFQRASNLFSQSKFEDALNETKEAIRLNQSYYEAYCLQGSCYRETGKLEEALIAYNEAERLNPKYQYTYVHRSRTYTRLNQHQKALDDAIKYLNFDPKDKTVIAMRDQAQNKLQTEKNELEEKAVKKSVAHYQCGATLFGNNKFEAALNEAKEAIRLNPIYGEAHCLLGSCYRETGKYQDALDAYSKAEKLAPDFQYTYLNRSRLYTKLNQPQKAQEDEKIYSEKAKQNQSKNKS